MMLGKNAPCPFPGAILLKRHFDDDSEESKTFVKIKPGARERARMRTHTEAKPTRKASYESSSAVQRWLREQAYEDSRPAFHPTLLASRRDAPWILSSLMPFYDQHLITDVLHEAHSGQDTTVRFVVATCRGYFSESYSIFRHALHINIEGFDCK
jgi:hypothetical protein